MPEPAGHLVVYRASRLEALVEPLRTLMQAMPPAHPLQPVELVTGHAGMRPWLVRELVGRTAPGGIVANLDIRLPSSYLEKLAVTVLGASAVALADYRREHLRWRVFEHLPRMQHPDIARYLRGNDAERRRFQLADHLAGLLSKYIVYRPDWLAAWARGASAVAADRGSPLPPLWQALRREIGLPHRGERLAALVDALRAAAPAGDPGALHLFGISHLAPAELAVFAALATHRPVVLYLPDPCREHWMGLRRDRAGLRAEVTEHLDREGDAQAVFLEQDHPLLASWGRLGQEFLLEVDQYHPLSEERHWLDRRDADIPPASRLQRVQESIRRLDEGLLDASPDRGDASLRVHACHTRLRELEVLRDALYDALNTIEGLQPRDIVVMAPDIAAYQPLLPAVFGEPGSARVRLPWHMADAPLLHSHPLLQAFARVLAMPASRLPVEEVLGLLRVPAVAARLRLDAGAAERIAGWLQQAGVAWALDGAHRARFDVPGIAAHSFAWGMDRLLAAHVFGDGEGQPMPLPDGPVMPAPVAMEGPQASDLGALDALLRTLQEWLHSAAQPRRASDWAERLGRLADALFAVSPVDRDGQAALEVLRGLIADIALQPRKAGLDPVLDAAVVGELLLQPLQQAPQRQPFLLGGMTVCGMVPQRAIPFRVVAVLGLNDGEFPRGGGDGGLDLTVRHRRLGDRDVRSDDRWLFLETVMAARERLHLSYIGAGARDGKPRNPAAPLAELMATLEAHEPSHAGADEAASASWRVVHRLQPFDRAYSDGGDPALFTHEASCVPLPPAAPAEPFADLEAAADAFDPAAPLPSRIVLAQVLRWYRDPARQLLRDVLGVRLDAIRPPLDESEPLDLAPAPLLRLPRRLLQEMVGRGLDRVPEAAPEAWRLDGTLPPGLAGRAMWRGLAGDVDEPLQKLRATPMFAGGWPPALLKPARFVLGDAVIEGPAPDALGDDGGVAVPVWAIGKKPKDAGLQHRVPAFVQWALLRLAPELAGTAVRMLWLGKEELAWCESWNAVDARWRDGDCAARDGIAADLRQRLRVLLGLFAQAQGAPLPYFPRTSQASLNQQAEEGWQRERGYGSGEAGLFAGTRAFEYGDRDEQALHRIAERIHEALASPSVQEASA